MRKKHFLPRKDSDLIIWLGNFALKLPKYAAKYGITQEEVDYVKKAYAFLSWILNFVEMLERTKSSYVAYKNEIMGKTHNVKKDSDLPTIPAFTEAPSKVSRDIIGRIIALGNRIKSYFDYTDADGADMGLDGSLVNFDFDFAKPVLELTRVPEGVRISYIKGYMHGISLYVRRDNGELIHLGNFSRSSIIDVIEIKLGEKHILCEYTAIFLYGDKQVGKRSDVASIVI